MMQANTLENRFQIARVTLNLEGKHIVLESWEHRQFRGAIVMARRMRMRDREEGLGGDGTLYLIVDRLLFPGKPPVYRLRDDGFTEGYRIPEEMRVRSEVEA